MKDRLLVSLVLLNSVTFCLTLAGFFTILGRQAWFVWFFLFGVLLNAVLFLILYRHTRRNPALSDTQRNRWEIALFLGSPVTFPLYVWRFVRLQAGDVSRL